MNIVIQATLHFYRAFFGLYMPITVSGRVTDIWRSYITQAILHSIDMYLAFSAKPIVTQQRHQHDHRV